MFIKKLIFLFLPFSVFSCSSEEPEEAGTLKTHSVSEKSLFVSTETSDFVGRPTRIKAYGGGLYFSDSGFQRITEVNRNGEEVFSFGSQGKGPGEFESPAGFWIFDDHYLVYDYNGFKFITYDHLGNLIGEKVVEENPVNPGFPPNIPITVHAISPHELLIPSGGRNGSLFAITNIETEEMKFLGESIGDHVGVYNQEEVVEAYSKGEIPDIFLNFIALAGSSSAIYSFQQTTGVLEKYSYSGELLWEKSLKLPAQHDLFDQISASNQNITDTRNEWYQSFQYADAMDATEEGVALLMNMPEGDTATAVWVPEDGNGPEVVTFEDVDPEKLGFLYSFTVSPEDKRAYFLNVQDGIIYQAEWPL